MVAVMVAAILVVMVTLPMGSLLPLAMVLAPMETMTTGPTSERHAPERHRQRQHQRREQHRNSLFHCFSPPSFYPIVRTILLTWNRPAYRPHGHFSQCLGRLGCMPGGHFWT